MKQDALMYWFTRESRRSKLFSRKSMLQLFSITDIAKYSPYKIEGVITKGYPKRGDIFPVISDQYKIRANISNVKGKDLNVETNYILVSDNINNFVITGSSGNLLLVTLGPRGTAPFRITEPLILYKGDIENLREDKIVTTYGRFVANYYLFTSIFKDLFPYLNALMEASKIENGIVAPAALANKITAEQCGKFIDHGYFPSSLCDIIAPSITRKSITENKEIVKERKKLMKELIDKGLQNNTQALVDLENKLIKMDKDNLKDDPSIIFLSDSGKKFNVSRKRQYSALGVLETFEKTKGRYDFVPGSLAEGWDVKSFVEICNEIRKGSYERGISTADGGLITKQFIRALQNETITGEDCHTKRTLDVMLTKDNVKEYYHSNMVMNNGSYLELTKENSSQFIGKIVHFRSMMYCEQKPGFCFICAGKNFQNMDFKNVGTQPIQMSGKLMMIPMKAMHGVKIESYKLEDIDSFVL